MNIFGKKNKNKDKDKDKEKNNEEEKSTSQNDGTKKDSKEGEEQNQPKNNQENPDRPLAIMKKGDYNVHVLVEEIKNLVPVGGGNDLPVPRVKITVFGKDQRTPKMKKPCDSFYFNEHFYFDKTNLTCEMLDSEKILIEVYDNKHTKRPEYFGIYELDFGYVYNQEEHALHNVWIGLANPESDDISKVRGYLKISVSVLQEADPRVELEAKENEISNCIIPTQVQMKYKQISFYFFRGEEFPDMDADFFQERTKGRRCDGYIIVKYMGIVRKTKVVEMKNEVVIWNQIVDIPATQPAVSQKISFVVKDEDDFKEDDTVGSFEINVDDIYKGNYDELKYIDIYGCSVNKHGGVYDLMNYNAEIGSRWNGRILMKCKVTDVDSPIARVRDIEDQKEIATANSLQNNRVIWNIWVRVISACYLPEKEREYSIRVSIQDREANTPKKKAINGSIDFLSSQKIQFKTITDDLFSLPDIYFYLVDSKQKREKEKVCFQRISAKEFHLNKDIFVLKLLPDPCIGKVSNMMKSGILKCKVCLFQQNEEDEAPTEKEFESGGAVAELPTLGAKLSKKKSKKAEEEYESLLIGNSFGSLKPFTIVAIVYMSKGLIAAESNGTSDPFVRLTLGDQTRQSSVKDNTINGIWNEQLIFDNVYMDFKDKTTWPIFSLSVFDYNKIKSDVPLGYNYLCLSNTAYTLNDVELLTPKWHDLLLPKSNKQQGQILLSFYLFDQEHMAMKNNINFLPRTTLYHCEMSVLGLRELKPLGMIAVKKPFVKFDLNSLNVTGKAEDSHAPIQTVPVKGGSNPTINTVIKFDAKLPTDPKFMPELQCEVYDHMLSGMHNSLLGVFSIDIKRIIKKTQQQIEEDIRETKKNIGMDLTSKLILGNLAGDRNTLSNFGLSNLGLGGGNDKKRNNSSSLLASLGMTDKNSDNNKKKDNKDNNKSENKDKKKDINYNDPLSLNKEDSDSESSEEKEKKKNNKLLDISKTINLGMKEKDEEDDLLDESDDASDKFIEENENVLPGQEEESKKAEKKKMENLNLSKMEIVVPTKGMNLSLRSSVKLQGDFIKNYLNDSNYFVVFPNLKYYKHPGYIKVKSEDGEGDNDSKEKIQKEFLLEDETKIPDKKIYFEVGYLLKPKEDIKPEESTKHYRRYYGCPLENVDVPDFKIKSPFNVNKIRRGKYVDKKNETSLFDAMKDLDSKIIIRYGEDDEKPPEDSRSSIGSVQSQIGFMGRSDKDAKSYGKFKGLIRIVEHEKQEQYEKAIRDNEEKKKFGGQHVEFKNLNKYEDLRKRLISVEDIVIRVYILELNELTAKDTFSESDPYIKLFINDKLVINERKNYKEDQKNCKWYKYYDIPGQIPGSSNLKIEVWDWDAILSDDLIGATTIDLEDRYFNDDWQGLVHKPIEVRPLIHPDLTGPQGQVYMWLEMFPTSDKDKVPIWKIAPEPVTELEVRFIVYETEEMEMMDVEGTSDIYVIGYIDQKERQKTDVHFRCQTGNASFNWRMLLPLKLPVQKPMLTMQVYDKDIFSSDDFMCAATINLKNLITVPKNLEMPMKFTRDYYNGLSIEEKKIYGDIEFLSKGDDEEGIKFWVQCYKGREDAEGEGEASGRVMCSLEILPKGMADLEKVGKGRDEPNVNPYLPPPVGRFEWSINPLKMFNQLIGPKFRAKCCKYCLCAILLIYLFVALPALVVKFLF